MRTVLICWLALISSGRVACGQYAQEKQKLRVDSVARFQRIINQIAPGFGYEEHHVGDLNGDHRADVVLVAQNRQPDTLDQGYARRVFLLICQPKGGYCVAAVSDNVIDCTRCGGGDHQDPHGDVTMHRNGVSFGSGYGGNQKIVYEVFFRYDSRVDDFFLSRLTKQEYGPDPKHMGEVLISPVYTLTPRELGRIRFSEYTTDVLP